MTAEEIKAKLDAAGITAKEFVRKLFPNTREFPANHELAWLGKVEVVDYDHREKSKHELENERTVFRIHDHLLRSTGVKEGPRGAKKWDYWEHLRPCQAVMEEAGTRTIYI